ncbi:TPA: type II toxin-antitoxin system YoeB family toxin [Clostridioides difficile]|uniref:type II toxin-antitoxin system YoeB family toxin n=1 Tax=Clostridioides difficile TaxID=1496 RepID=UPI00038D02CB|nr:type II toxin-antitoxin system YoeB family toxin [Clostridioides difficile]AXU54319.1 hypothetical protein CDIF29637_02593 [Clostridioides difficile]EGT3738731.1 hypothetical protein [Clostridioides difficile]EGT3791852.1 hypothetical protein [Clostridioides difficile]EGT4047641.1 hypothetical protein [Clostridioides difficile]EGT4050154.1 hypothetical protein [Clostridioides difficile]
MQIEYDEKVEKYFSNFDLMRKKIGNDMTKTIKKRINQLMAADTFGIYLSTGLGKPHSLENDLKGFYGVSISKNYRLIIKPNTDDLSSEYLKVCKLVKIKGVEDYHGTKHEWIIP